MILNEYRIIAYNEWLILSERFSNFKLDVFQIMPNHIHCIIILNPVRATLAVAPDNQAHIENHAHIDDHVALDNQAHIDNQAALDNQADADGSIDQNNGADGMGRGQGRALPLRWLVILWVHTNLWWQIVVWIFINQKMKLWVNYGNVIITNTSYAMNKLIKTFQITSSIILRIGTLINFIYEPILPLFIKTHYN